MKRVSIVLLVISLFGLALLFFYPRNYQVPQSKERPSTKYWNLSTGSKIAYTYIPAKRVVKPFPIIFLQGVALEALSPIETYLTLGSWVKMAVMPTYTIRLEVATPQDLRILRTIPPLAIEQI